ncbi:hypothetical protein BVY01_01120 [bacterium I07]|nr:hypothetical protein BVY01_01120 [bacterium I07]
MPATTAVSESETGSRSEPRGMMAAPGEYTATLMKEVDGKIASISEPVKFNVERMRTGALKGAEPEETVEFWKEIADLQRSTSAASRTLQEALKRTDLLTAALKRTPAAPGNLDTRLHGLRQALLELDEKLNGNRSRQQVGEPNNPTINRRISVAMTGTRSSTYGPTPTHKRSLEIAHEQFKEFKHSLEEIVEKKLPEFEKVLQDAGAPWVKGQPIPEN